MINSEYKIVRRYGKEIVFMRINGTWIKSSLTPHELRSLTGERIAA